MSITHVRDPQIADDIQQFIQGDGFPCVGAKSAFALGQVSVVESGGFMAPAPLASVHDAIRAFGDHLSAASPPFNSFLWAFARDAILSEAAFEARLWQHLQALHDRDVDHGIGWAQGVSKDPKHQNFSMSIASKAYFVIGLHPGASRKARRFCRPLLVFNAHEQFEQLRQDGRYGRMQAIIRQREMAQSGSLNPMIGTHGVRLQAPQFSGRAVSDSWQCPLRVRKPK